MAIGNTLPVVHRAPKKTQSVCIHALGPQIYPLDLSFVCELLKSIVTVIARSENTP